MRDGWGLNLIILTYEMFMVAIKIIMIVYQKIKGRELLYMKI